MTARASVGNGRGVPRICRALLRARLATEVTYMVGDEKVVQPMTQGEVAKRLKAAKLKASQSMIARWEGAEGGSEPSLSVIERLERIYGLERGDLLRDAGYVGDEISVPVAIARDRALSERDRDVLLASYRAMRRKH